MLASPSQKLGNGDHGSRYSWRCTSESGITAPPRSKWLQLQWRAAYYAALLLALNYYFAANLFRVEFTYNMGTNAGSFMAISRFMLQHWPPLGWFPWWFNGEPFENAYTPLLQLVDAAFAWITGSSTARAYNFVTGGFYVLGPQPGGFSHLSTSITIAWAQAKRASTKSSRGRDEFVARQVK